MNHSAHKEGDRTPTLLFGICLIVFASQIYISLFSGGLKISVAVALLPVLTMLSPDFSPLPSAALSACGIFLLRLILQPSAEGFGASCLTHAPEVLFYLVYGMLFPIYLKWFPLRPVRLLKFLPLVGLDTLCNLIELLVRTRTSVLHPTVLVQLLTVGVVRALLSWAILRMLDTYSIQVLHREEAERYQRLVVMTATLKSEVAWMTKGTVLIEETMRTAYRLYSGLRDSGADRESVDAALTVAKDIHEVKKEYFQIVRGISEALEGDDGGAMELSQLVRILKESTRRTAQSAGKNVAFHSDCQDDLPLRCHHYLMSIFRNLLNNAAPDGAAAHLRLTERSEGSELVFQVADDCGGIPPQHLAQVFVPGFSSKINDATGEVNRGLGLAIVKELVEDQLGGRLRLESQNGGTTFTIWISKEKLTGEEGEAHANLSD